MKNLITDLTIKDWLIGFTLIILVFLIMRIRKLRKIIIEETLNRLMPELGLMIEGDAEKDFYLKNYSISIARNIRIEDAEIYIEDFGFKTPLKVVFEGVDALNPADKVRLNYKIFHHDTEADPEMRNKYMTHILFTDFDIRIHYDNIQNRHFISVITNRKGKFSVNEISEEKIKV